MPRGLGNYQSSRSPRAREGVPWGGTEEAIWPLLMSDARNPYCHPSPTDPSVSRIS